MAILRTPLRGHKTPSYGARVVVRVSKGRAIFQLWPRKRGRSKNATTIAQNLLFKERVTLAKYAPGEDQWMAIEIAKNSPLYPRDLLISAMAGRLFETITVDGKVFTSVAVRDDISADLDLIGGNLPGTMLVRGPTIWEALFPGTVGEVLTTQGPDAGPLWLPGAGQQAVSVGRDATLFLVGGVTHPVPWDRVDFDDNSMFDAANPTRLTMPNQSGRVQLSAGLKSTGNVGGAKIITIRRNGTDFIANSDKEGTSNLGDTLMKGPIEFAPGDYFEVTVFASFAFTLADAEPCFFTAQMSLPEVIIPPVDPDFAEVVLLAPFSVVVDDDASDSDHTLTPVGGAAIVGGSLSLNGTTQWVTLPDSPDWSFDTAPFTLEGFFDIDVNNAFSLVMATSPGNAVNGWFWEVGSSRGSAFAHNAAVLLQSVGGTIIAPAAGRIHLALTRDGDTLTSWREGVLFNTSTISAGLAINTAATDGLFIGATTGGTFPWDGLQGNVRITKGINRYPGPFTPPTEPLPIS